MSTRSSFLSGVWMTADEVTVYHLMTDEAKEAFDKQTPERKKRLLAKWVVKYLKQKPLPDVSAARKSRAEEKRERKKTWRLMLQSREEVTQ